MMEGEVFVWIIGRDCEDFIESYVVFLDGRDIDDWLFCFFVFKDLKDIIFV